MAGETGMRKAQTGLRLNTVRCPRPRTVKPLQVAWCVGLMAMLSRV